jgi:hypothetical protein
MHRRVFILSVGVILAGCTGAQEEEPEESQDNDVSEVENDEEEPDEDEDEPGEEQEEDDDEVEEDDEPDAGEDDTEVEDDDENGTTTLDDEEAIALFETEAEQVGIETDLITVDEGESTGHSLIVEYYSTDMGVEWEIEELTRIYLDPVEDGWTRTGYGVFKSMESNTVGTLMMSGLVNISRENCRLKRLYLTQRRQSYNPPFGTDPNSVQHVHLYTLRPISKGIYRRWSPESLDVEELHVCRWGSDHGCLSERSIRV